MEKEYVKNFDEWNKYVKHLELQDSQEYFSDHEVWWCAIGVNVGSEIDGKNDKFERPVLVIVRMNQDKLFIAPITSNIKNYSDRVTISLLGKKSQIILSQTQMISSKRLLRRISLVSNRHYQEAVIVLLKILLSGSPKGETPQ